MANVRSLEELLKSFQQFKSSIDLKKSPEELYSPVEYMMDMEAKRIRPLILLFMTELLNGHQNAAMSAAYGLELFHNFTLVHDDIMDQSDLRRSKTTVHKKYGINEAILSGDVMMIESIWYIHRADQLNSTTKLTELFIKTAREVCEGQSMDMAFENKAQIQMTEYLEMIRLKTAVLLACSFQMATVLSQRTDLFESMYQLGILLGQSFQLEDDWLDFYAGTGEFGKVKGGDIIRGKKSALILELMEPFSEQERLHFLEFYAKNKANNDFLNEINSVFEKYNIRNKLRLRIEDYKSKAIEIIAGLKISSVHQDLLIQFIKKIFERTY